MQDIADINVRTEGAARWLVIDRPEKRNALTIAGVIALAEAVEVAARDPAVRCLVVTGQGDLAFSAGADLGEQVRHGDDPVFFDSFCNAWLRLIQTIDASPLPVIAAVRGHCVAGGFEIALACHLRVATPSARFGLAEIRRGHLPGAGGLALTARALPMAVANLILLTGDPIDGEAAFRWGFISHLLAENSLESGVAALVGRIASLSPAAVRLTLEAIRATRDVGRADALKTERALCERIDQIDPVGVRTGMTDFLEGGGR